MRLVLAITSFLLAAVMLTLGIVQRTILAPPDSIDLSVETSGSAPLTVIEGGTLLAHEGRQTLTIEGDEDVVAAYGRTNDVYAWIGEASYNLVSVDPVTGELVSTTHRGTEQSVPNPYDSDLWYEDYQDEGRLRLAVTLPADVALVIASDGTEPAPPDIAISWPLDNSTPWSGPLIIGGAVLLVLGLILLLIAIHRIRSNQGPRRKMPKVPKQKTIRSVRPVPRTEAKRVSAAKAGAAIAIVAAVGLLLAGIPSTSPAIAATSTPSPTPPAGESALPVPAVTSTQLDRIVERVSSTISQADSTLDNAVATSRMSGPALALKLADYTLRSKDGNAVGDSPAIPADGVVALRLPQQVPADTPTWPRTVMVVVASPESLATATPTPGPSATPEAPAEQAPAAVPPVVLVLGQASPRENYKVQYLMALEARVPEVAAPTVGAAPLAPDSPLLSMPPNSVAAAYADVLTSDTASASAAEFDLTADNLAAAWGLSAQVAEREKQKTLESPNNLAYATAAGSDGLVALATTGGGALVAATVQQVLDVTPAEAGAKVIAQGDIRTLSGVERSERGYRVTYGGQVLFLVPALDSDAPITVLAFAQGLLAATELP